MAKKYIPDTSQIDIALMPPQAIELEEAILGALMLERDNVATVLTMLKSDAFYLMAHTVIYKAIQTLYKESYPIDIMTVTQQLIKTKELDLIGGAWYITQLTNKVASSANTEFHARIVQQKYIARELIRMGSQMVKKAYDPNNDIFDIIGSLEKSMVDISQNYRSNKYHTMHSLWNEMQDKNQILLSKSGLNGVPSGFINIDRVTGGWQNSDLVIIAARPSMGKTAYAINCACNEAVQFKIPTLVFSLEMAALQLFTRMVSSESSVSNNKLSRKGIEADHMIEIEKNCFNLINGPLFIDDTPGISLPELVSKAREHVRKNGIKIIYIDYLQLMTNPMDRANREQEISSISRGLKKLAKELELPIIALSQLSRATEQRGGQKRPMLADLRESGAIEQDADIVLFIHRPEYYGIYENETGQDLKGVAEMIFAKHRNGPLGTEYLGFIDYLTKFVNSDFDPEGGRSVIKEPKVKAPPHPDKFLEAQKYKKEDDLPF